MQGNKSAGTRPETAIRSAVHRLGRRFRKHVRPAPEIPCRADLVFPTERVVVFVDGCYWHRCPEHGTSPRTNSDYWSAKLDRNVARDRRNDAALAAAGWAVVRGGSTSRPVTQRGGSTRSCESGGRACDASALRREGLEEPDRMARSATGSGEGLGNAQRRLAPDGLPRQRVAARLRVECPRSGMRAGSRRAWTWGPASVEAHPKLGCNVRSDTVDGLKKRHAREIRMEDPFREPRVGPIQQNSFSSPPTRHRW